MLLEEYYCYSEEKELTSSRKFYRGEVTFKGGTEGKLWKIKCACHRLGRMLEYVGACVNSDAYPEPMQVT